MIYERTWVCAKERARANSMLCLTVTTRHATRPVPIRSFGAMKAHVCACLTSGQATLSRVRRAHVK